MNVHRLSGHSLTQFDSSLCISKISKIINISCVFSGVQLGHEGECGAAPTVCICQPIHMPVCGKDNQTYDNQCQMDCQ